MSNIVIGYKNLCLESGVIFTESSEDAAHPVENLAEAHPARFWRITTLTGTPNVAVSVLPAKTVNLIAPLCVTASPHTNAVRDSNDLTTAQWTAADLFVAAVNAVVFTGTEVSAFDLTADGGLVTPTLRAETYTKPTEFPGTPKYTISCYFDTAGTGGSANLTLELEDGSDFVRANFDGSDGSLSSTNNSTWSLDGTTTEVVSGTVHRVSMTATVTNVGTTIRGLIRVLDSGDLGTYTSAGEAVRVGGIQVDRGDTALEFVPVGSDKGRLSLWNFSVTPSAASSALRTLPLRPNLIDWYDAIGWIHSYVYTAAGFVPGSGTVTVNFYDPHNADSQLDISNIYIGPALQPSQNFMAGWTIEIDPITKGRIVRLTLDNQSEADAYGEYLAMALKLGVGTNESTTAAGGQQYRYGKTPVLVILDPEEDTYGQEQMIYGWVDSFTFVGLAWNTTKTANMYRIELTISEVMK